LTIVLLFGLLALASAVGLALRAAGHRRTHVVATLGDIGRYGYGANAVAGLAPKRPRVLGRLGQLADRVGEVAARFGWLREDDLRTLLRSAGLYELGPRRFFGYRILAGAGLPLLWLWAAAGGSPVRTLLGLVVALALGWFGPLVYLKRRSRLRLEEIDDQMPELIDLLVTTVEAGLGLSASLRVAAERLRGALGEELRLTLAEQDMGLSTEDALANMLERAQTATVRSLVRSLMQGMTLGVSVGKIMRDLADEMRKRRKQRAEERAQKAPTKMLFPLVLLIFPAMFVVLLGPAVVQLLQSLDSL
jgi:tight adherence protein C